MIEFLRGFGALGAGMRYEGGPNRGYTVPPGAGLEAGSVGPPPSVPDLLASQLGFYFPFESTWDQAMLMFQPVGGMDRIPYALADAIDGADPLRRRGAEAITIRDARRRGHLPGTATRHTGDRRRLLHLHDPAARAGRRSRRNLSTAVQVDIAALPAAVAWPRWVSSSSAASGRRTRASSAASPTPTWT